MARTQTMVQLTDELVAQLDREAFNRGVSRSALVREAIESFLADSREREIGRRIVEGYTRIPPSTPDGWGNMDRLADVAVRELASRLDEEERKQGLPPW